MAQVQGHEFVIERGEGSYVWDVDGNKYFDGTASLWCVNVGHGRHEIADAARAQMDTLATYQTFGGFANKPVLELADRLAVSAEPIIDDAKIFFGLGGGDAIETAAKLARRDRRARSRPHHRANAGLPRHARARYQHWRYRRQSGWDGAGRPVGLERSVGLT